MDIASLERKFMQAHTAGDAKNAAVFAAEIKRMRAAGAQPTVERLSPEQLAELQTYAAGSAKRQTEAAGPLSRFLAGAGSVIPEMGAGIGQRIGVVNQAEADKAIDAPVNLRATPAGMLGTMVGQTAAAIPAAIAAGPSYLGAALIGAGFGAAQPTSRNQSAALNAAVGAAGGVAGQKLGNMAANLTLPSRAAVLQSRAQAPMRDATNAGIDAGLVVPPMNTRPSNPLNWLLSVGGKTRTAQKAALKNIHVVDDLAREDLGIPKGTPITTRTIEAVRNKAGRAYEAIKDFGDLATDIQFGDDIANLGGKDFRQMIAEFPDQAPKEVGDLIATLSSRQKISSRNAVTLIKELRNRSSSNFRAAALGSGNDKALRVANTQREAADALESLIERNLAASGKSALLDQFKKARVTIAKAHDYEDALFEPTGNVIASRLRAKADKGKPLSGNAALIANFEGANQRAMQGVANSGWLTEPGLSPLDMTGSVLAATQGSKLGALGLLFGRPLASSAVLTRPYQSLFARPVDPARIPMSYNLLNNPYLSRAAGIGAAQQ